MYLCFVILIAYHMFICIWMLNISLFVFLQMWGLEAEVVGESAF
jgi:hypothetical protein